LHAKLREGTPFTSYTINTKSGWNILVLDTKSQNIPEVVFVRRWAVGVLRIWREGVGI
jgi:hypothetical protein